MQATIEVDKSREGHLIHNATSSGRWVKIVAYIEGTQDPRYMVESNMVCRSSEQAREICRVLNEARWEMPT
jgi:hypothetical protein